LNIFNTHHSNNYSVSSIDTTSDQTPSRFGQAFRFLIQIEQSYINDPLDSGGPTKFGITSAYLKELQNRFNETDEAILKGLNIDPYEPITEKTVKSIFLSDAKWFYKHYWWIYYHFDEIKHNSLSIKLFSMSVNMGPETVIKDLQTVVNREYENIQLKVDGILGPKTLQTVNQLPNIHCLLDDLISHWIRHYCYLVDQNADNARFINGWIKRAIRLPDG